MAQATLVISSKNRQRVVALPDLREWVAAAKAEPDALEDLEVEF